MLSHDKIISGLKDFSCWEGGCEAITLGSFYANQPVSDTHEKAVTKGSIYPPPLPPPTYFSSEQLVGFQLCITTLKGEGPGAVVYLFIVYLTSS